MLAVGQLAERDTRELGALVNERRNEPARCVANHCHIAHLHTTPVFKWS